MPGRLHTCYSPVRRSPAADGKPSAPLPLDLHVLSLSLAFILSQDQTLRCYLYLFLFFRDHAGAPRGGARRRGGRPARRDASLTCLFGTDRGLHLRRRRPGRDGRRAPVLFFLIHCKTFNVLSSGCPGRLAPKNFAKLATFSETTKFSGDFFSEGLSRPSQHFSRANPAEPGFFQRNLCPESECKVRPSFCNHQIFPPLFSPPPQPDLASQGIKSYPSVFLINVKNMSQNITFRRISPYPAKTTCNPTLDSI